MAGSSGLKVLIVGAGIGGLTAAIGLRQQGHHVWIFEKSRFATEVGAAIHLAPNCTTVLEGLGLPPAKFGGTLLRRMLSYTGSGMQVAAKEFSEERKKWQADWYLVHRVHLHNELKRAATSEKGFGTAAFLSTACQVTDVDCDSATITLQDGRVIKGDLILGADGVHSISRKRVVSDFQPFPSGKSCFRWLVPKAKLLEDPKTRPFVEQPGTFIEWAGENRYLIFYPCSDDTIINFCAFVPDEEIKNGTEGTFQITGKAALLNAFSSFAPDFQRVLEYAPEDLQVWKLLDMDQIPTWSNGRTALLGDAAHPFLPFVGQGAAMAMEDGACLTTLLPLGTTPEQVPERLKLYQQCRKERVDRVQDFTRHRGKGLTKEADLESNAEEFVKFTKYCITHNTYDHARNALSGGFDACLKENLGDPIS